MKKRIKCSQPPRELRPCERPKPNGKLTHVDVVDLLAMVAGLGASVGVQRGPGLWRGPR